MTPGELIEKMASKLKNRFYAGEWALRYDKVIAKEMLKVVLQAIKYGEIVKIKNIYTGCDSETEHRVVINQPFTDWMEK